MNKEIIHYKFKGGICASNLDENEKNLFKEVFDFCCFRNEGEVEKIKSYVCVILEQMRVQEEYINCNYEFKKILKGHKMK